MLQFFQHYPLAFVCLMLLITCFIFSNDPYERKTRAKRRRNHRLNQEGIAEAEEMELLIQALTTQEQLNTWHRMLERFKDRYYFTEMGKLNYEGLAALYRWEAERIGAEVPAERLTVGSDGYLHAEAA